MKKMIIAGGNGFLGRALSAHFQQKGYQVKSLIRKPETSHHIQWDGKHLANTWVQELEGSDVLINLCGKSVDCRYTPKNKQAILNSRIDTTNILQKAVNQLHQPPKLWINASSATIYIHSETQLNTEQGGTIGDDFSMNICKQWEQALFAQENQGVRKIALRTSIVLGNGGGALPKLKQITKLGLGGHQGHGQQLVSWIHLEDFCRAIQHLIEHEHITSAVNITAPQPVTNHDFMLQLRKEMQMPWGISQPKILLELGAWLIRTETELLLKSRNVYPKKLIDHGFTFLYPTIQSCLSDLC